MAEEQRQEGGGSPKRHAEEGPDAVEHGKPGTFDPKTGEVHGSGSGAGGGEKIVRPIDADEGA